MYNILISGYYGFNNIGDEAVLRTVVDNLRGSFDDIDLTILSHNPADTEEKFHLRAIPRMSLPRIIGAVRRCDMLISGGGSLLQDATSPFSILYYLFIIALALLLRKKVFIYSQGVGPIRRRLSRRLTARCLRRADGICVRDQSSAELLEQMGIPSAQIHVTADPVIRLDPADLAPGREILSRIGCRKRDGRLLVGWALKDPLSADGRSRFVAETVRGIRYLKETYGADSVLIPFHYEQDMEILRAVASKLGDQVYCITDKHLSGEMLSIIGNMDVLVGVRLHSLIYACVMDVPCIGISYDPKIDAFLHSVGQTAAADIQNFSLSRFQAVFADTLARREEIVAGTHRHMEALTRSLEENDQILRDIKEQPAHQKRSGGATSAIGGVMIITVIAKLIGILRESVQAGVYGTADLYYSGYNKTIYLFTTAAYAMSIAAVPIITRQMAADREQGLKTAHNLTSFSMLLSLLALGLWELTTLPPLSGLIYGGQSGALMVYLRVMALSLPVIVLAYLMVAVFQSMGHYALQGSMSLPYSIFLIAYLALLGDPDHILGYVIAVSAAWLLQLAMALPYARREKYRFRFSLDLSPSYIRTYLKTIVVTIITGSMYLFCYLTDASFAGRLDAGTTSAFYYADKIFTPLTTTFIYSISAVMFPKFSRHYAGSDEAGYKHYVWNIASGTLIVVFPVCMLLIAFGAPIIRVLFESGSFTAESTAITARVFVMYAAGMAGFSLMDLLNKAFFTMNRVALPLGISLATIALNLALDQVFHQSDSLLALSTSIAMTIGAAVTVIALFRGTGIVHLAPAVKSLLSAAAAGVPAILARNYLLTGTEGKLLLVVKCGGIGAVALAVYVGLCFVLRLREITDLLSRRNR